VGLLGSFKRIFIGTVILAIAFYVSVNPDVAKEYAGQWVSAAMMVVSFYLGSHTEKMKAGEDSSGDEGIGGAL
jgi:hypothetical protein